MRLSAALLILGATAWADTYSGRLLTDRPAAYWRFDSIEECCTPNEADPALRANAGENVSLIEPGPRYPECPLFSPENTAADFTYFPEKAFLRIKDPGAQSALDFKKGETITLGAWVRCAKIAEGQTAYVVSKGHTGNSGTKLENQNWALILVGAKSADGVAATAAFQFCDERGGWHRFKGTKGFTPDKEWHHIACTYTFGTPTSAKVYINGEEVPGVWDLGGATDASPVVDDDEVWIGGSMGGKAELQFPGQIDEVAIFREALPLERVQMHATRAGQPPMLKAVK